MTKTNEAIIISKDPTVAHQHKTEVGIPSNLWKGLDGRFTLDTEVKDYEKLREAVLVPLFERWMRMHEELADLKAQIFRDSDGSDSNSCDLLASSRSTSVISPIWRP